MKRAPAFWWSGSPTLSARLLQPAGAVYGALTARRMARPGLILPVPVICVGNLVAGGAGKTPTALALVDLLRDQGQRPAVLSRGYGRDPSRSQHDAVIRVDPAQHDVKTVGDEPLLLAAAAPTYVAIDRRKAARQAMDEGATVLILDDGLQNPALAKTLSIAVVDGASGIGNGMCVPAGPLRAPVARQWRFVHAVCVIGEGQPGDSVAAMATTQGLPVLRARLRPDPAVVEHLKAAPLLAFAGIGRPEKFFATLEDRGLTLRGRRAFPDHHTFTTEERDALRTEAAALGARLVTTAKDRVRLPPDFPATILPVVLAFENPDAMRGLLANSVPRT